MPGAAFCAECGGALAPGLPRGLCSTCALNDLLETAPAETLTCPKCGAPVPHDSPAGQCPGCLLGMADDPEPQACFDDRMRQPRNRQFGDYILGRQLGSGGMGIVYEAQQISLNRKVALKFIRDSQVASPLMLRRFTIEAEATARLHHPHIVGIHEIGEVDGQPYFSMDLVEGDSLRVLLARGVFTVRTEDGSKSNGRSRQVTIARLMAKAARALHHAHQRGVLHRDLKPANILIDAAGEPRLSDFGLAKILRLTTETDTRQSLTGTGDIAGTPSYMSPEQASSSETTGASDVYGLGAVLYELLTGKPPFRGNTVLETLQHVQESPPKAPRSINPLVERDLETICLKCLEKDPLRRFASAEALAEDLENWIDHKPINARPVGRIVRAAQWTQRNRTGTALIAALVLGLSTAIVLLAVAKHQAKKRDEVTVRLFRSKVDALNDRWNDTNTASLSISSEDLAVLANRDPIDPATAKPISIGVTIRGDAINFAQRYANQFGELESIMTRSMREPVQLNLAISKWRNPDSERLEQGLVDFSVMEATSFLEAQRRQPGLTAVARIDGTQTGALVVSSRSRITNAAEIRGRAVLFGGHTAPLTIAAKAWLAQSRLTANDVNLEVIEEELLNNQNSREILAMLFSGDADAGVTSLRRYHLSQHQGLNLLTKLTLSPRLVAARSGLDTNVIKALQKALLQVGDNKANGNLSDENSWEEETGFRAVPIDAREMEATRELLRQAARFDGKPDPFPAGPEATKAGPK